MLKSIGIYWLVMLVAQTAFCQVVSQPSIDDNDFTFVKVTPLELPFLKGESYILFSLCFEEAFDCSPIGKGLYALEDLEAYHLQSPAVAQWVFQPGVLEAQSVVLLSEPIETYLEALKKALEAVGSRP